MHLSEACYRVTGTFPRSELFGLVSQIRRASISIPCNLAEGHCRRTTGAFLNHVSIALGSHGELSALIELSAKLDFISAPQRDELDSMNEMVGRLLYGLHRSLDRRLASSTLSVRNRSASTAD
jgi:four helix bundle protein